MSFPRDTRCDAPARMEIIINDIAEWGLVKFYYRT